MGREEVEYLKSSHLGVLFAWEEDYFDVFPRRSWHMVIFNLRQVRRD